ncbi:dicarboxylate/amino acid:cation symporter [Lentisalinibacter sediminis]|uniref:dicarboxylate/amino acid:cation symporter n=1 Tax=Lentisalinibacter sediminis TaxID=2992237 RepID=UPI00386ABE8A
MGKDEAETETAGRTGVPIWTRVLIGLVAGALTGAVFGERILWLDPVGQAFIAAIKMLVVPLIFVSLVGGISSIGDLGRMGRIGGRTVGWYLVTTAAAIPVGLAIAVWLQPGAGMGLMPPAATAAAETPSMADSLVALIPENAFAAFSSGDNLQVIVFSLLFGIALAAVGEKGTPVTRLVDALAAVIFKLTEMIIAVAPIGVFALIAVTTGRYGIDVLLPLGKLIAGVYAGCLIHAVVTLGGLLAFVGGVSPLQFFRGVLEAQIVAFSTTTAAGTLPVTISCARHNLGVSEEVSGFVLPIGATINMDGTAIYQAVTAVFIAQAYGIDLTPLQYGTILVAAVLASIGTAAIPAAGLMVLSIVLTSVGLPLEGIALVAGIDRILDMARTTVNVTGDAAVSVLVAQGEGELDLDIFNERPE